MTIPRNLRELDERHVRGFGRNREGGAGLQPAMMLHLALLSVMTVGSSPQARETEPRPGTLPPLAADVVLPDTLLHQDRRGGAWQRLLGLAAAPGGGFTAVWADRRDGHLGLYGVALDEGGRRRAPEAPLLARPDASRLLGAESAMLTTGGGLSVWVHPMGRRTGLSVRAFDALGRFRGPETAALAAPTDGETRSPRAADWAPALIARAEDRGFRLAWNQGDVLYTLTLDVVGRPDGEVRRVATGAEPGVQLARGGEASLAVWPSRDGLRALRLDRGDAREVSAGSGRLVRLVPAVPGSSDRGFWALVHDEGFALRHLSADGAADREDTVAWQGELLEADLAAWSGGLALVAAKEPTFAEPEESFEDGEAGEAVDEAARAAREQRVASARDALDLRLWLLDADGERRRTLRGILPARASDPEGFRVASNGERLLLGWSEGRHGDRDVFVRAIEPRHLLEDEGVGLLPEQRVNSDEASSDQTAVDVASDGVEHAVAAWQDSRFGRPTIFARRVSAEGPQGDEFRLPAPFDGDKARAAIVHGTRPVVAVERDGAFCCAWMDELEDDTQRVVYQAFGPDGSALCEASGIDVQTARADGQVTPAIAALGGRGGYRLVWVRADGTVCERSLQRDGARRSAPQPLIQPGGVSRNPDLTRLDDDRWVVVWDHKERRAAPPSVWARLLGPGGRALGSAFELPASETGSDWDPVVAPGPGRGFLCVWNAGSDRNRLRDLHARFFDARGKPRGDALRVAPAFNEQDTADVERLPDESFVIAWEDDFSHHDQVHVRRLSRDGETLGPVRLLSGVETVYHVARVRPRLCLLGDRLLGVFGDRRRSLGWDASLRVLGPAFDAAPSPPDEDR